MRQISSGAEAQIYLEKEEILKKRLKKDYRIAEIDETLRKSRTRTEIKILQKAPIKVPKVLESNQKDTIRMEYIKGEKVRDALDNNPSLAEEIGRKVATLHDAGIIHGDLTTSNMILKEEIYFIDFGLSFFSQKAEDKAVDIHLFLQALESKHYRISEKAFEFFLKGYNHSKEFKKVMDRFKAVEKRGRHKKK